ncbi:hypothetical protein [Arcobacter sp. 7ABA8]|uniref:hypothetical protein n=1 Tax=Arcobacter sp. 7ABA8 TaxID=3158260 RepID=UPI003C76EF7E
MDGVLCDGRSCYQNTLAMNATIGINRDGTVLKFDGNLWHQALNNDMIVSSGSTYISKNKTKIIGISSQLLYYDNCSLGLQYKRSIGCSSKGMRVPYTYEAKAWNGNGVNSCSDWTFAINQPKDEVEVFLGTSYRNNKGDYYYARCVK